MRRPFWLHQAAEYIVGLMLVLQGLRSLDPLVPAIGGALVLVNAAVAQGPLTAFGLVGRSLHRRLDLVVIVVLLVGAAQPWISVENISRILLLVVAVILLVIWVNTDFSMRASGGRGRWMARRRAGGVSADAATGAATSASANAASGSASGTVPGVAESVESVTAAGRTVGRVAGRMAGKVAGKVAGATANDAAGTGTGTGTGTSAGTAAKMSGEELGRRAGRSVGRIVKRLRSST